MSISLEQAPRPTAEARALIEELEAELSLDFAPHQRHGLKLDEIFQPHIAFFVARLDGAAVGCGGVAFDDGFAEIKRMYVHKAARGRGVGQAILSRLEREARARGYARLVLETGDVLDAARRLYERAGFKHRGAFGRYAAMPSLAIEHSRFFEKSLV